MPQPPGRVELQSTAILLGVDHEHSTGPDHQMVDIGLAARDGQAMQHRPAVPLQRSQAAGGAPLPGRPAPPGDGIRAGPEPQPPAGRHGGQPAHHDAEPGHHQAAKHSPHRHPPRG
jgi:hypothetical protein